MYGKQSIAFAGFINNFFLPSLICVQVCGIPGWCKTQAPPPDQPPRQPVTRQHKSVTPTPSNKMNNSSVKRKHPEKGPRWALYSW